MDILKTTKEIGFIETGINLSEVLESHDIAEKVGATMPLPTSNISNNAVKISNWLLSLGKSKYLFFTPEIALMEHMAKSQSNQEVIILVPCDMDKDSRTRLQNNIPKSIKTELLNEPFFPEKFFPSNGVLVVIGYLSGNKTMVLPETYRMLEHYGNFMGKKVFIPYTEIDEPVRYSEWLEVSSDRFTQIWRCGNQ